MTAIKLKDKTIKKPWYFTCRATINGVRKKIKRRGFATKLEALIAEKEFLNNYDGSTQRNHMLISIAIDEYLKYVEADFKETTFYELGVLLRRTVIGSIGDIPVSSIKETEKTLILSAINDPSRTLKYNKKLLFSVNRLFEYMVNHRIVGKNIITGASLKKRNETVNKTIKFWTKDQFNQFIEVVNNPDWELFYRILFITGLRAGEAQALQVGDYDPKKRVITVSKSLTNKSGHGHYQLIAPKTEGSRREVLIPEWMHHEIMKHVGKYKDMSKTSFLFGITKPWSNSHILRTTREYCKDANVPYIGIRGLRHSMASLLVSEGVNIMAISDRLGHKRVSTTLDTYSHMYKSKQLEALDKLTK